MRALHKHDAPDAVERAHECRTRNEKTVIMRRRRRGKEGLIRARTSHTSASERARGRTAFGRRSFHLRHPGTQTMPDAPVLAVSN